MAWTVLFHDAFMPELAALPVRVQDELLATVALLVAYGPELGRPHADTLAGSTYGNMKELRFRADDGVWRVAFAFDPVRRAIMLCAGDKTGITKRRFYKRLIARADARFADHIANLELK